MINQYLPCAAASAAKDGEAPESSHDGSLREKQNKGSAVCVCLASPFLKQASAYNPCAEHRLYYPLAHSAKSMLCC